MDLIAAARCVVGRTIRHGMGVRSALVGPEARLQKRIADLVRKRGGWCTKVHQSGFGVMGVPDLLCCYRGLFVAFEVKNPDGSGRVTPAQSRQLALIQQAGGMALVVDSLDEAEGLLDALDDMDRSRELTDADTGEKITRIPVKRMEAKIVHLEDFR